MVYAPLVEGRANETGSGAAHGDDRDARPSPSIDWGRSSIAALVKTPLRTPLALLGCGALLAWCWHACGFPVIYSDGYYYVTTARNFVETGRFTYDTMHSTNGFHWGWMGLLIGLSALLRELGVSLDGRALIAAVAVIDCAFYVAAAREFYVILSRLPRWADLKPLAPILTAFVFLEPNLMSLAINGLETSLFLFLLLRLVRQLSDEPPRGVLPIAVALTLTRIEGVVLAPLVIVMGPGDWRARLRRGAIALTPLAVILLLNYAADGSWLSNSSEAKAHWAQLARHDYLQASSMTSMFVAIAKEVSYLPGFIMQLALSIRDDRWMRVLWIALAISLFGAGWRKRSLVIARFQTPAVYVLAWYCGLTWIAYKTIYFTPRTAAFSAQFAIHDYQSVWYFAPMGVLVALVLYLVLFTAFSRTIGVLLGVAVVTVLWARALSVEPHRAAVDPAACQPPPRSAVYVAQNDDGFAYWNRLPIVVLDGLVTGTRLSDHASYLAAVRNDDVSRYLAALKPRFLRVSTERVLTNLNVPGDAIGAMLERPVVHLCGIGDWYDLASMRSPAQPDSGR